LIWLLMGEESQAICIALRAAGEEAYSCDLQDCSGGHPEWHIKGDMFEVFDTLKPDAVIAHPTCTYMCNSGALRLYIGGRKENGICPIRWAKMVASAQEFKRVLALPVKVLGVENPIMHKHAAEIVGIKYSQIVQPYQFGHAESKATCLWLKGVPTLFSTNSLSLGLYVDIGIIKAPLARGRTGSVRAKAKSAARHTRVSLKR
jgi:hypothetical protein